MGNNKKLLISSGDNKSHLIAIAGELNNAQLYSVFLLASFYPKLWVRKFLLKLSNLSRAIFRLIDRAENIDEEKIYSLPIAEIISKISTIFNDRKNHYLKKNIENIGMKYYGNAATKILKKVDPKIYHFRCCYGLKSLDYAISKKMITICDHTICHPRFLWTQLKSQNKFVDPFKADKLSNLDSKFMNDVFKSMEYDLEKSQNILVNSELVKKSCIFYGLNSNKIKVIYIGCDKKFLSYKNYFEKNRKNKNHFLYAGSWEIRKGVIELSKALLELNLDITLSIAGASLNDVKNLTPYLINKRIKLNILGYVNREKLAEIYSNHQIFLMPSLAEGSARVGFEALASGCFVITTSFAGTIVKDNLNGYLVDPGNVIQLKIAIQKALDKPKKELEEIMFNNFLIVRSKYTPEKYVENLHNYYKFLESK